MGADKAAKRYRGKGATQYEAKRQGKTKWLLEDEGVRNLLSYKISDHPIQYNINTVLDVPIGTGRFHSLYAERNLTVTGVDTSPDMLKEAYKKGFTDLHLGDIRSMPFADKSFDAAICIRLFAWFEPVEVFQAMKEMARVADVLIVNIRTNKEQSFCKSNSLWNHLHNDFLKWVNSIGYKVDADFQCGDKGNGIYRLISCE